MQAEQLCREVEAHRLSKPLKSKGKKNKSAPSGHGEKDKSDAVLDQLSIPPALQPVLEETFGFKPTSRTLIYIMKRFTKLGYTQQSRSFFQKIFKKRRINEFWNIYKEVLNQEPFRKINNRNIDLINAVNFALFDEIEGSSVAKEGLKFTLKWRKDRSSI
jgi:hypothetical protein